MAYEKKKIIHFQEYIDIDLERKVFLCHECGYEYCKVEEDTYRRHGLVRERDPRDLWPPEMVKYGFAADPEYLIFREYICPQCGVLFDVDQVPPGYPVWRDIELDLK